MTDLHEGIERTFNQPALLRIAAANDQYLREHWGYLAPVALLAHARWAETERLRAVLQQYEDAADWYRRCLEDIQDMRPDLRPVRDLAEAKAAFDTARDRALKTLQEGDHERSTSHV